MERCLQIWQVAAGDCRHSQRFWVWWNRLKVGYSAPSGANVRAGLRQPPASMMPVSISPRRLRIGSWKPWHCSPTTASAAPRRFPTSLSLARAELAEIIVLHCDEDFDLIASVTGQLVEWLSVS